MQIPESVQIGPFRYQVQQTPRLIRGDKALYGAAEHERKVIELEAGMDPQQRVETFLHEVLHCLSVVYDLGLSEHQIEVLSPALLDTLRRNALDVLVVTEES